MGAKGLSSRAIIGSFYNALEQDIGQSWVSQVSMLFQSDQESETYKWLGMAPGMREWVSGRLAKGFRENGITIENKKYEATLEVLVDELRRDKTGQVLLRIQELAQRTNAHWAKLLSDLIIAGEAGVCYDSQYFFDTDHSEGDSGTQSNDLSVDISELTTSVHGSTTAPSVGEISLSILQAIQAMVGFVDDQGEPMNENAREFMVMTPISLLSPAIAAVENQFIASGEENTLMAARNFDVTVVGNARLSSWTTKFGVYRTDGQTKPFIRQEEEEVTMNAVAEGSELEFNEDKHHYGVKAIRNVGYGYWQHACLVTMT